jgi:hypothetical protein
MSKRTEELKLELNELSIEELREIAEFCSELADTLDE